MASPNVWTRERKPLSKWDLDKAVKLVAAGEIQGRGHEWADTECTGLVLRACVSACNFDPVRQGIGVQF